MHVETQSIMGMPITIKLVGGDPTTLEAAWKFFRHTDEVFSTYKDASEVSRLARGELTLENSTDEVREVLAACDEWKRTTNGYFDAYAGGTLDPSGYVKGWSIARVAEILRASGANNFLLDAGGDMVAAGQNQADEPWRVGIRVPWERDKFAKVLRLSDLAIATSGTYERGSHIIDPTSKQPAAELASVSVIGPDIIAADVLATTIFAMGSDYPRHIDHLLPAGYEVYVMTPDRQATFTPGFEKLVALQNSE